LRRACVAVMTGAVMGQVVDLAAERERRGVRTERLWTKAEIAAHFGVSTRTVERWMRDRGFPCLRRFEGGSVRFRLADCEAWLRGGR
jgi:excisionase family DNA binding protein